MLALTLDTSCVIHGAQRRDLDQAELVDRLVLAARAGMVSLWLTTTFHIDQERATREQYRANLAWLAEQRVTPDVAAPFGLEYSQLDGPDVVVNDLTYEVASALEGLLLPRTMQKDTLDANDSALMVRWRRKVNDVQHLIAHHMAGHHAFVTSDYDDMISKADFILARTGIRVWTLERACKEVNAPNPPEEKSSRGFSM